MVTIPDYWYDCRIWQYRKNGSLCQDIIGDVLLIDGVKFFFHRN